MHILHTSALYIHINTCSNIRNALCNNLLDFRKLGICTQKPDETVHYKHNTVYRAACILYVPIHFSFLVFGKHMWSMICTDEL